MEKRFQGQDVSWRIPQRRGGLAATEIAFAAKTTTPKVKTEFQFHDIASRPSGEAQNLPGDVPSEIQD